MQYPQSRILVFCKAPQPGKVKTRLAKDIGESAAATVHENLAWHCLQQVVSFSLAPVELWCAPHAEDDFFHKCHAEFGVPLKNQVGEDLGQRMQHALRETLGDCTSAILIGTDCPALTADYLCSALVAVNQNKAVIGPAEDGGYVLLAVNKLQPQLFVDMPWGTSRVYEETINRLTGEVETLKQLWDIDYIDDLRRLRDAADGINLDKKLLEYVNDLKFL